MDLVDHLGCRHEYLIASDGGDVRGVLPLMWPGDEGARVYKSLPFYGSHGSVLAVDRDRRHGASTFLSVWLGVRRIGYGVRSSGTVDRCGEGDNPRGERGSAVHGEARSGARGTSCPVES